MTAKELTDKERQEMLDRFLSNPNLPDFAWFSEFNSKTEREQARELRDGLPPELWPYTYRDETFGWCIKHPLYWEPTGFHHSPTQIRERFARVKKHHDDAIAEGNWGRASVLIASPHGLDWVLEHEKEMGPENFREQLASAWIQTEYPHAQNQQRIKAAFRRAGWMTDITGDVNDPNAPPRTTQPVTLYRGTTGRKGKRGMSWTAEPQRAVWFAKRWSHGVEGTTDGGQGHVWSATVEPRRIFAYFYARGEAEFVIDTTGLEITEEQ